MPSHRRASDSWEDRRRAVGAARPCVAVVVVSFLFDSQVSPFPLPPGRTKQSTEALCFFFALTVLYIVYLTQAATRFTISFCLPGRLPLLRLLSLLVLLLSHSLSLWLHLACQRLDARQEDGYVCPVNRQINIGCAGEMYLYACT